MNLIDISDKSQFKLCQADDHLNGTKEIYNSWINEVVPSFSEFKDRIRICINKSGYSKKVLGELGEYLGGKNRIINIEDNQQLDENYIPIFWGILHGNSKLIWQCIKERRLWIFCDHAYLRRGHDNQNYRMTINGYGMKRIRDWGGERYANLKVGVGKWRNRGEHVLICPPTSYFMKHHKVSNNWTNEIKQQLLLHTDRVIRVREKPVKGSKGATLDEDLNNCHAVVTHMSNVAIDAVVKGIPVFVNHNSAAHMVGSIHLNEIESPVICDRKRWLNSLAWNQFTQREISDGDALWMIYKNAFK